MRYFLTGTDTDVGKTVVSCGLLERARASGATTSGLKPIAAGAHWTVDGLRNNDALALAAVSTVAMPYHHRNPICLEPAIAPHVALERATQSVTVDRLLAALAPGLGEPADLTLVEGAGGWMVPLNSRETVADFALALTIPVIVVVGLRLGCLNHALLTVAAIEAAGIPLAGWVGNSVDPAMRERDATIATLHARLAIPCLGIVPHLTDPSPAEVAPWLVDLSQPTGC